MSDDLTPEPPEEEADKPEIDWKAEARKHEQRSKDNLKLAKDNEAAAQRLAELEAANKTEAEKQAEALAEAQSKLEELTRAKTRAEVAAAKGIPANLLAGSSQEELEASADALIAWRGSVAPTRPVIDPVPASGTGGGSQGKSVDGNALYERATGKGR